MAELEKDPMSNDYRALAIFSENAQAEAAEFPEGSFGNRDALLRAEIWNQASTYAHTLSQFSREKRLAAVLKSRRSSRKTG